MKHYRAQYELAIAQTIKILHEASGLSRRTIAQELEIPELEVTRLETGSEPLSAGGLMVLLKLYELSWQDFESKVTEALPQALAQIKRAGHSGSV